MKTHKPAGNILKPIEKVILAHMILGTIFLKFHMGVHVGIPSEFPLRPCKIFFFKHSNFSTKPIQTYVK
jgi:hypothetical protein